MDDVTKAGSMVTGRASSAPRPFARPSAIAWSLALIATVPLLSLAIIFGVMLDRRERADVEKDQQAATAAIADTIDHELATTTRLLEALAGNPALSHEDFATFHQAALGAVHANGTIDRILLADARRNMTVVDTSRPFPLEPRALVETGSFDAVVRTGEPAVMPEVVRREQPGMPLVGVRVPVKDEAGTVRYVMTGLFSYAGLAALVKGIVVPPGWVAGIVDAGGTILARNINADKFVGTAAAPGVRNAIATKDFHMFRGPTLDGIEVVTIVRPIASAQWYVAIGLPAELFDYPLRQFSLMLIASIAAGVLIAGLLTALVSRRFLAEHRLVAELSSMVAQKNLLLAEFTIEYDRAIVAGDKLLVYCRVTDFSERPSPAGRVEVAVIEEEGRESDNGALVYRARRTFIVRSTREV